MSVKPLHIHAVLALLFVSSFAALYFANAVRVGKVVYEYDFMERTPFVSDFWPPERFDPTIATIGGVVRPVVETPVTFFVHPTRSYGEAQLHLTFKFKKEAQLMVSYKSGPRADDFSPVELQQVEALENGFWKATVRLNMKQWHRSDQGRYTIKLDSPGLLAQSNTLWVKHITVELSE